MQTRRDLIRDVLNGKRPAYVPWHFAFTQEARAKLDARGTAEIDDVLAGHFLTFSGTGERFFPAGEDRVADAFGVIWDRSRDKDIGVVANCMLPGASLCDLKLPNPIDPYCLSQLDAGIASGRDGFRIYCIGFSLYERAWTLRGMENLMMDFIEHPDFVHQLLGTIADWNIAQARAAMQRDIDAVYFGDDWGQQQGLQMGPRFWKEFIYPQLRRMYAAVHDTGRNVFIHSCGDVDELFDDLAEIGVNCFNPFQPEVMDVEQLIGRYRGRLTFHGGLSTQRTLPYGTGEQVIAQTRRLLTLGREGGYIFAPAHAVEGDVPVENMIACMRELQKQEGYRRQ